MRHWLLVVFVCSSCAPSARTNCDDPSYALSFRDEYPRYLFENNVMPYEGYTELESFLPSRAEVIATDSVLAASGFNTTEVKFAQYGGFITRSGERIVAANYVYNESKDYPGARCDLFFGLGKYFEENTRQGYVNVSTLSAYDVR